MSNSHSVKLTINGISYPSLSDLAKQNNLSVKTVIGRYSRYKKGLCKAEDLIKPARRKTKILPNGITINNVYYKNSNELAKSAGISKQEMYLRICKYKNGKLTKNALLKPSQRLQSITIADKHFDSIKDAAQYCNITEHALRVRLSRLGNNDPRVLRIPHTLIIDGQYVSSLREWCLKNHLGYPNVRKCIEKYNYTNLTTQKIKHDIYKTRVTFDGVDYKSMSAFARDVGLNRVTLITRLKAYKEHKISKEDVVKPGRLKKYYKN